MNKTIGIVGNGQLGRMLALAAYNLGFKVHIYGENDSGPANFVTKFNTVGKYDDLTKMFEFMEKVDFLTYEFENIDETVLIDLETRFPEKIFPKSNALYISNNRNREKKFLRDLGIKTADFWLINSLEELEKIISDGVGDRFILKTCEDGYDGRGQFKLDSLSDFRHIKSLLNERFRPEKYILEKKVDFAKECSVIVVREKSSECKVFPIPENYHKDGILHSSIVPSSLKKEVKDSVAKAALEIAERLEYIGVLAVEFFITHDDEIIANEIAPRVHNSGHYTMDACNISQFEAHIRAISGLKMKNIVLLKPCKMRNLIGREIEAASDFLEIDNGYLHLYGKEEIRDSRKMGHINILDDCLGLEDEDEVCWNESLLNKVIDSKSSEI
jgi:5-(carboxyamino)imidazole ribonucleotide synthase